MTHWKLVKIVDAPSVELIDWAVFEVQLASRAAPSQHLVGSRRQNPFGKVSSAIVAVDPARHCILTESGRIYALQGTSGLVPGNEGVWQKWLSMYHLPTYTDLTEDVETLLDAPKSDETLGV